MTLHHAEIRYVRSLEFLRDDFSTNGLNANNKFVSLCKRLQELAAKETKILPYLDANRWIM